MMGGMSGGMGGGDPWTQGFIAIGGTTAAGVGAMLQQSANQDAAKAQRRWSKMMYENRYRMTMQDMAAAGLNPILAARTGGFGVGGIPGVGIPPSANMGQAVAQGMSAGAQLGQTVTSARRLNKLVKLEADKLRFEQANLEEGAFRNRMEGMAADARRRLTDVETSLAATQLPSARAAARFDATRAGTTFRQIGRAGEHLGKALPGIGILVGPRGNVRARTRRGRK